MDRLEIYAPAKINIHLEITGIREDGFHNILTVFQMVSLYDRLTIIRTDQKKIVVKGDFNCKPEDNLIYKAAEWMMETYQPECGFDIFCDKNIPAGAGLGGGSSDAAAVLAGIFRVVMGRYPEGPELMDGASLLGSDVPFFLGTGTAVGTGRGEILKPIDTRSELVTLLVHTGIHSNTAEAFKSLEIKESKTGYSSKDIERIYCEEDPGEWNFINCFKDYLQSKWDIFRKIESILDNSGSEFTSITGTGSSLFGVFGDIHKAAEAEKALKKLNIQAQTVKMLANSPWRGYN